MSQEAVNANEFRVIGMSRSGNHAIIDWMLARMAGRTCFLNCVEPRLNPFLSARPIQGDRCHWASYPDFDLDREQAGQFSRKDNLVYSYEDCFLRSVTCSDFERRHDACVGASARRVNVLILRDPYNLFASRLKSGLYSGGEWGYHTISLPGAARIWKQHAREFLGERNHLAPNRVLVSYNRWTLDPAYRADLAERLGLRPGGDGLADVPATGGGSSFDGLNFHGRAADMKVFERWKHFAHDPAYRRIFDPEMRRLAERIFGSLPGIEELFTAPAAASAST